MVWGMYDVEVGIPVGIVQRGGTVTTSRLSRSDRIVAYAHERLVQLGSFVGVQATVTFVACSLSVVGKYLPRVAVGANKSERYHMSSCGFGCCV